MEKIESRARRMGFTMLEIIVVMGIIGILLTIMMPLLSGTRNSAAMRMAMMPTTTSTSTIVKPVLRTNDFPFFISLPSFFEPIS